MAEPKTTTPPKAGSRQARQRAQKEQEADLETLVAEVETRVDRLRAAYDQYFMGIEKLPPHVQIKDVERRLQDLRKIQIRNTALRFKFQNTLQKYNTYQSYWQRIVRQIEEGTYKRDVRRANERFGAGAQRKAAAKEIEIDVEFEDLMSEEEEIERLLSGPPDAPGPADGSDPDDDLDTLRPEAPPHFEAPRIPRATGDESRRLQALDATAGIAYVAPKAPIEERPSQKHVSRSISMPLLQRPATNGLSAPAGPASAPQPTPGVGGLRLAPRQQGAPRIPAAAAAPAPAPVAAAVPSPSPAPLREREPEPVAAPGPAPTAQPPRKRSARPAAASGAAGAGAPNGGGKAPAARAAPKPGDLSDERVRQLYSQYVETKRSQKESTAAISYDSLAKSLRESTEKLKEKHGAKKIDFEVTVKDGKTILRPIFK